MIDFTRSDAAGPAAPAPKDAALPDDDPRRRAGPAEGPSRPEPGDVAALGDEIARLSAHIQAATSRLLVLIRAFDEQEGWHREGFRSCARWLGWRTGIGPGAAREKVRVARALGALPALSAALERGELSYSVARALTRVATPANEAELLEVARHTPAAQLERLVRAWRAADRAEDLLAERARHAARHLTLRPAADGSWVLRGRMDPEVGAVLREALDAAAEGLFRDGATDADAPAAARRADALGRVAEAALGGGLGAGIPDGAAPDPEEGAAADGTDGRPDPAPVVGRAERFQVVIHVSAETLAGGGADDADGGVSAGTPSGADAAEVPRIAGGPPVSAETARRLACDAAVVSMVHGRRGEVLDVGRRTRSVPPALRRALDHRDGGCVFPGCGCRFCDAHHIVPWAEGGETRLANLVLLCRHHHRRVHEDGWRVERTDGGGSPGAFTFRWPDGRPLPRVPPTDPVPDRPAAALVRAQAGLGIDADTPTPAWDGARMDVDWALFTLRRPGRLERARPHGDVSAETRPLGGTSLPDPDSQRRAFPRRRLR